MAKKKTKKADDEDQEDSSGGSIAVNDAWTGMLLISLLGLIIATSFLAWDWSNLNDAPEKLTKIVTTGPLPGAVPVQPPKVDDKKDPDKKDPEKKDEEKKDPDKKDPEKKDEEKKDEEKKVHQRIESLSIPEQAVIERREEATPPELRRLVATWHDDRHARRPAS